MSLNKKKSTKNSANCSSPEMCYPLVISNNSISPSVSSSSHSVTDLSRQQQQQQQQQQQPFPIHLPVCNTLSNHHFTQQSFLRRWLSFSRINHNLTERTQRNNNHRISSTTTATTTTTNQQTHRFTFASLLSCCKCLCEGFYKKFIWSSLTFVLIFIIFHLFMNHFDSNTPQINQHDTNQWPSWHPFHLSRSLWSRAHRKFSNQTYLDINNAPFVWQQIRLPRFVRPIIYDLYMWPNMSVFTNTANVTILLDLYPNISTNFLVLHSRNLNIDRVKMFRQIFTTGSDYQILGESQVKVIKYVTSPRLEQLYIEVNETLSWPNRYRLSIDYYHKLSFDLEGFYVSSYLNNVTKKKHHLLTTHFEPTSARSAFPCFDEPALKAKFAFRIRHDAHFKAFFNSPLRDVQYLNESNEIVSIFENTVPMSTYLVAFVLCDFTVNKTTDSTGLIEIRTVVPEDQALHTKYALDFASKALDFYHNFFRVSYPLPKLDMIAVPDFGAGAMENWGIITFRMTALIYNEKDSSAEMKEIVGTVIAHELAHQWFGNLVTMNWWDELWLNEGFASYVENLGVDSVHPEWKMLDQFVISTSQPALALDSLLSSHPIHATVKNPSEIEALFDMISYKKGSCLIRMIEQFIGKQALQKGLQKYLNHYMFNTATTSQLWTTLSEFSESLNVTQIMQNWIHQAGFPLLSVRWNAKNDGLIIRQQRFISSLGPEDKQISNDLWNIPVTIVHSSTDPSDSKDPIIIHWLMGVKEIEIALNKSEIVWYKLNYDQAAFYRVNYDQSNWRELIQRVSYTQSDAHFLSAVDRAGLLDDAFALLRNGYLNVNTAMDLTRYLEYGEMNYVPWETALNHFGVIDTIMDHNELLQRYIVRLIKSVVRKLGWQESIGDSLFEIKLRAIILRASIFYGNEPSVSEAKEIFNKWMKNGDRIAANIRETVYHAGIQYGNEKEYNFVWNKYLNESDASEKRILLSALSSIRHAHLLESYLNASLNKTQIRSQDFPFVIQSAARNPIGRNITWNFVRNNWQKILNTFGQGSFSLDIIIAESIWHFSSENKYQEIRQFFNGVEVGSGQQSLQQSLEKIRSNIYWKKNVQSKVMAWLQKVQF